MEINNIIFSLYVHGFISCKKIGGIIINNYQNQQAMSDCQGCMSNYKIVQESVDIHVEIQ